MADTITKLKLWPWFRDESPPDDEGYSWWNHVNIFKISSGIPDNPHSGATFAYCLRQMQAIAKQGFTKWAGEALRHSECSICMNDLTSNCMVKTLGCGHCFHSDCIAKWLVLATSCPICRGTVEK